MRHTPIRRAIIGYDERRHRCRVVVGPIRAPGWITFSYTLVGRVRSIGACSVEFLAPFGASDFIDNWWRGVETHDATIEFHDGSRRAGAFWAVKIDLPPKGTFRRVTLQAAGDLHHVPAATEHRHAVQDPDQR
jgi:hypothetical protein